jgi:hypothetical protein
MYDWLKASLEDATLPQARLTILRNQDAVQRMRGLDLRDRWGYQLEPSKLAEIAAFVLANTDMAAIGRRGREAAAIVEVVDRLAIEMLTTDMPMFCPEHDTPPDDTDIEEVVRAVLNLKEPS